MNEATTRIGELSRQLKARTEARASDEAYRVERDAERIAAAVDAAHPALALMCTVPMTLIRDVHDARDRAIAINARGELVETTDGIPPTEAIRSPADIARIIGPGAADVIVMRLTNLLRRHMPAGAIGATG